MKQINEVYAAKARPIKVLQFGEGNFLRAFVNYAIDVANEKNGFDGNVAIIIPRSGKNEAFAKQGNVYTVCLRGKRNGKTYEENRVITSVATVISARDEFESFMALAKEDSLRFVVSNTTEAGICVDATDSLSDCPPKSFPGKLTKFLYERYCYYKGAAQKGLIMLPTELLDNNGQALKNCVFQYISLWKLEGEFAAWVESSCQFVDTLVDRIVTGYPTGEADSLFAELGYKDLLLVKAEPFSLWAIGNEELGAEFPVQSDDFHVEFTNNIKAFKEQKVRILNGAHTSMVLGAYLAGLDYVGQCMVDPVIRRMLDQAVFGEIVPTVHLPREKAEAFAHAVYERFENPFVKHALLSIALNSVSKWKARVMPTLKDSIAMTGTLPKWLTFSLAALLAFYRTTAGGDGCLLGKRGNDTYEIHDDAAALAVFQAAAAKDTAQYVASILSQTGFWGEDLTAIPGFVATVTAHVEGIETIGAKAYIEQLSKTE